MQEALNCKHIIVEQKMFLSLKHVILQDHEKIIQRAIFKMN